MLVAFLRRSKEDTSGLSLPAQLEEIRRAYGEPDQVYEDDDVSGALPPHRRPGLTAALQSLGKGDVLALKDRTRLARDVSVAKEIELEVRKRRACLVTVNGSNGAKAVDKLHRNLDDVLSQWWRDYVSEQTREALNQKRQRGEKLGGSHCPYGFTVNGDGKTLHEVPEEQAIVQKCLIWRKRKRSMNWIARRLDELDIPARSGSWHPQKVKRILERVEPAA